MRVKEIAASILLSLAFLTPVTVGQTTAEDYFNKGIAAYKKGLYDEAIANYSKTIELNPRWAEASCGRGLAHNDKGEYDSAISDYNKALELKPNYGDAYFNRGIAHDNKGEYDQAISD